MKVIGECKCPICGKSGDIVYFCIKAGFNSELRFRCPSCRIHYAATALGYKIDTSKAEVSFSQIASLDEIIWDKVRFNPSER